MRPPVWGESGRTGNRFTGLADAVSLARMEVAFRGLWTGVARWELTEATEGGRGCPACNRATGELVVAGVLAVLNALGEVAEDNEAEALCKMFPPFFGVEGVEDSETGKMVFRIARRGRGLMGRSTVTNSSSASSSELLTSPFPSSFSSAFSTSQSLCLFLVSDRGTTSISVADLGLYFGKAEGGRPGFGCRAEESPRNVKEVRDLDGFSGFFEGSSPEEEGTTTAWGRLVGLEDVGARFVSFGVDLSVPPVPLEMSKEGRAPRLPSRVVVMTGLAPVALVLAGDPVLPARSDSVLDKAVVELLSLFITSARAFPTDREMVKDSRFGREGRVGELI